MEKKYFAYFHYEGAWFGYVTDTALKRNSVNWMISLTPEQLKTRYGIEFYVLETKEKFTKREISNKIKEMFPGLVPVHVIQERSGPRAAKENGSRPFKGWTKRDYVKNSKVEIY